jgi:hypothetical protein
LGEYTYNAADVLRDTDEYAVPKKKPGGAQSTATVFGLAALMVSALVVMEKAGMGSGGATPRSAGENSQGTVSAWMSGWLDRLPKSTSRVVEDRFQVGLGDWLPEPGASASASTWRIDNGLVKPGGLRIWDTSRNLSDYTFAFEGRVENAAMGWVVRAPNHRNYYAAKLSIPDRGVGRPEIIRFSVIQGQESRRQHYPIPMVMDKNRFYDLEVRAVGDRILTLVGGRVVDHWRDARFPTGGVGFFSEKGDRASIRWARLSEGESFADKLRSYLTFGLVVPML